MQEVLDELNGTHRDLIVGPLGSTRRLALWQFAAEVLLVVVKRELYRS